MTSTVLLGRLAFADVANPDGDTLKNGNNITYGSTATPGQEACASRGAQVGGLVTITYNGNTHFDAGANVSVSVTPRAGAGEAQSVGITATGGTATVPTGTGWDSSGDTFTVPIGTTTPATVPDGTYDVDVEASGPGHDNHNNAITYTVDNPYTVTVTCGTVAIAPAISWTANPATANAGDTKTYSFSIADADSSSWSFVSGSPDCGAGTVSGSPSIDNSAKTGTFDCAFPNAASTSVSVQVTDGGLASNTLTQSVAVNGAPAISWTADPATANAGDTKTYSFSIADADSSSWSFVSGSPDCGAGTVSGSPSIDNSAKTGTFDCAFPNAASTSVSVQVTDGGLASNTLTLQVVVSPSASPAPEVVGIDNVSISANINLFAVDSYNGPTNQGTVASNTAVTLSAAKVSGSVTSPSLVLQKGGDPGTYHHANPMLNPNPVDFSHCPTFSPSSGISGKFTYDPKKGDLTVSGGNSATLAGGQYCFHNVTISGGSKLYVSAATTITLTGQFNGSGGSLINLTLNADNLQVNTSYAGNNAIVLSGGTNAYALLYAPNGTVTLSGGSPLFGAVLGKALVMSGSSMVHCDLSSASQSDWAQHFA